MKTHLSRHFQKSRFSVLLLEGNFLESSVCPDFEGEERIDVMLEIPGKLKMERIHSNNSKSEEGYWYDQDQSEWVMVLRGKATV